MESNASQFKISLCSERLFFNKVILADFQLIDTQSQNNYENKHITGAQHIDLNSEDLAKQFAILQRNSYAERKDQVLVYTTKYDESKDELEALLDLLKNTKATTVSILQSDFDVFAKHYPFLITNSKQKADPSEKKTDEDSMLSDDEDTFETSDLVYPCHVHDHIYLGSEFIASQQAVLSHLNITHVLNATHDSKNHFENSDIYKATYHRFKIHDNESEDLVAGLKECFNFIDIAIKNNGKVLVHCAAGRSRSPSIIIGYFIYKFNMTYQEAYNVVRESRDYLQINDGFVRQLENLENEFK